MAPRGAEKLKNFSDELLLSDPVVIRSQSSLRRLRVASKEAEGGSDQENTRLDIRQIIKQILVVEATVTELLREFPRLRRAALAGEKIVIRSREGDLQLMRDTSQPASLVGAMRGQLASSADDIDQPATKASDWAASL